MGVRQSFVQGPVQRLPGTSIIGTAVTLQFMPQREDIASGIGQEHAEKVSALWRVLDEIRPGDVLVVQAYGDRYTGCLTTTPWSRSTSISLSTRSVSRPHFGPA